MNFFQEIKLCDIQEISLYFIWQKLYMQLHIALVENKQGANASVIGVSFPSYDEQTNYLGDSIRLIASSEQDLVNLDCKSWLKRLGDYVDIGSIKPVPEKIIGHACFKHIKYKGNKEKLARRRAKRKGETLDKALLHFRGFKEQRTNLPYVYMQSQTNRQMFRLFIEQEKKSEQHQGKFSCYGLSNTTTVPLF